MPWPRMQPPQSPCCAHPGVDPEAVGLFGHSQAGWVIPAAARRSGADVIMVLSGGGISPRDQEIFRARAEAAAAGLPADDAARLMELKWNHGHSGEGWETYIAAVAGADPGIAAIVETPSEPDPSRWALLRALSGYDPLPDLRAIRVPTLVVFGDEDDNVPVDRAAEIWRANVPASLLTMETFPGLGHALLGLREGVGSIFTAPFVATLDRWLDEYVPGSGG